MGSISSASIPWIIAITSALVGALLAWFFGLSRPQSGPDEQHPTNERSGGHNTRIASLLLPVLIVLLIQLLLIWPLAETSTPPSIPTAALNSLQAEHQKILAELHSGPEVPITSGDHITPPSITSFSWILLLVLPFAAACLALLLSFILRRFYPHMTGAAAAAVTAGAGALLSVPFTLFGTVTIVDKFAPDLFSDFALFKFEQTAKVDPNAIANVVADRIQKDLADIKAIVAADITNIISGNISEQFKQQIIAQINTQLAKELATTTKNSISHFEKEITIKLDGALKESTSVQREIWFGVLSNEGTVDCGKNDDLVVGTFKVKEADKLDDGQDSIGRQLDRIVERIRASPPNRYLSALILVGSADRLRLTPPPTNDDLARMRAEWVRQALEEKLRSDTDTIAPPKIIVINQMVSRIRVSKEDGRDLVRAVQVCALWVTPQRITQQGQAQ